MTQIDYASAGVLREPWGPVGFKWSVRSMILVALVLAAGVWLRLRHLPYTAVTVLPVAPFFMGFHDDGHLVTADPQAGVRVWDVWTGKVVENPVLGTGVYGDPRVYWANPRYFWDEKALLVVKKGGSIQQVRPGREPMIRKLPGSRLALTIQDASASAARLVGSENGHPIDILSTEELETGTVNGPVRFQATGAAQVSLSRDGGTRLFLDNGDVRDFSTMELVTSFPRVSLPVCAHEKYDVTLSVDHPSWRVYLRDYATGAVWHSVQVHFNTNHYVSFRLSPDGQTLAVASGTDGIRPGQTRLYDMPSERMGGYYERDWGDIQFLANSKDFLCFDPPSAAYALFRVGSAQPLARLPNLESSGECPPVVSPNGRWMACGGPQVRLGTTILKRTGWDCLPSPVGMLVFPQTWLLALAVVGAAWSLRRDARRVAVANAGGRSSRYLRWGGRLISGSVFVVLVMLTVQALLVVGLGRRPLMTAAPVLLIGWIGLGTGSRFWRVAAMVICAGALAWCLWCFLGEWRLGFGWSGSERVELLDRVTMWPRWIGMSGLAVGAMVCGIAVGWLALMMASNAGREQSGVS
jgi:hypothetical protein